MLNRKLTTWVVVGIVFLYLLNFRLTSGCGCNNNQSWTVYGTKGCGWTRKQLDYMNRKKISHKFVNCDEEDCGDIRSYPTLKSSQGNLLVGFNKV